MIDLSSVTYEQKVLLYLKEFQNLKEKKERSEKFTQKGVAENVGLSRTHASRVLKRLTEKGLVEEEKSAVKGHKKKLKTYFLERKGIEKAETIYSELSEINVKVIDEDLERNLPLSDIEGETGTEIDLFTALSLLESSNNKTIDLRKQRPFDPVKLTESLPEVEELYGREEEIRKIKNWMNSETPILAVLGRRGHGATSISSKFIQEVDQGHILWVDLKRVTGEEVKNKISKFLEKVEIETDDLLEGLLNQKAILVFDDYYEVEDEIVGFLSDLLGKIDRSSPLKIMITGRKGTPVYERFYQQSDIEKGLVKELHLSPLDEENAQKILGKDLEKDALERIMMFTKGSPLLLKLLKEGKEERLCELTPWEEEQISLLMYLKTQTRDG
ncbi:MAG: hypothetical protein KGY76_02405 [Candidatus Thermoplasmatota archaeon]|nr:hypothetical protein [Candidatus Thermoplasmatota archaeon]